jgi:hypothetical protein
LIKDVTTLAKSNLKDQDESDEVLNPITPTAAPLCPQEAKTAEKPWLFKKGNQLAKNGDRAPKRIVTQQLISILNEEFRQYDQKTGKFGKGTNITKMRRMLDNLVFNATVLGETQAIREIIDRVQGKPAQAITDADGNNLEPARYVVEFIGRDGNVVSVTEANRGQYTPPLPRIVGGTDVKQIEGAALPPAGDKAASG